MLEVDVFTFEVVLLTNKVEIFIGVFEAGFEVVRFDVALVVFVLRVDEDVTEAVLTLLYTKSSGLLAPPFTTVPDEALEMNFERTAAGDMALPF